MYHDRIAEIRPPIAIDANHFARLSALSSLTSGSMTEVCEYLREELDRAHVLPAEELCPDIVSIGSEVEFRDEQTGKSQKVILVYPLDADIAHRRVSVLTPVGAALLGLSINQTISFRTRTGERRELTVLKVGRATSSGGSYERGTSWVALSASVYQKITTQSLHPELIVVDAEGMAQRASAGILADCAARAGGLASLLVVRRFLTPLV